MSPEVNPGLPEDHPFTPMFADIGLKRSYPVLIDEGNQVASQFNLVHGFPPDGAWKSMHLQFAIDLQEKNRDASWQLPTPSVYIVDSDSTIRWAQVQYDYKVRAEPTIVLEALKALTSA